MMLCEGCFYKTICLKYTVLLLIHPKTFVIKKQHMTSSKEHVSNGNLMRHGNKGEGQ